MFKSLKHAFYRAMRNWTLSHPGRKVSRAQFPVFLSEAWKKAAVPSNAQSGFEACGLYPYNPERIPEEAFQISDMVAAAEADRNEGCKTDSRGCAQVLLPQKDNSRLEAQVENQPMSGTSFEEITPVPILNPLPSKRRKKTAEVLTEETRKEAARVRTQRIKSKKSTPSHSKISKRSRSANDSDYCAECAKNYYDKNGPQVDWIQCVICNKWLHETCTEEENMCNNCANEL